MSQAILLKEDNGHLFRVETYTYLIAQLLGIEEKRCALVSSLSILHDVGKSQIPDAILFKNGKLTGDEEQIMRKHTTLGFNLLRNIGLEPFPLAAHIAHEHHERWDGLGYPRGISGNDIILEARIVCAADILDALLSKRAYKESWEDDKVIQYFMDYRKKIFDPQIADIVISQFKYLKIGPYLSSVNKYTKEETCLK